MAGQRTVVAVVTSVALLALVGVWLSKRTPETGARADQPTVDPSQTTVAGGGVAAPVTERTPTGKGRAVDLSPVLPVPVVVPRQAPHISRALSSTFKISDRDDEGVSKADIERAKESLIRPLPPAPEPAASSSPADRKRRDQARLYNFLHPYIQDAQVDASPIVTDFNCIIGEYFAARHPNSTVLCVHLVVLNPIPLTQPALGNLINFGAASFVDPPFNNFYRSCNLISTSLLLSPVNRCKDAHIKLAASMSKATFVLVPSECRDRILSAVASWTEPQTAELAGTQFAAQEIATAVWNGGAYRILRIINKRSERICSKVWAGQKMFNRKIIMAYDEGLVKIRVVGKSAGEGRTIHPLQYLPSVNLETIQMMGISSAQAEKFFGQVVSTPQYSDPRPHNWVLTGGGRLARIDKFDARFEAKYNESTYYWGVSTRGYFHFQGHHLCLPLQFGIPTIMSQEPCRKDCLSCVTTCSYLPRGSQPCPACMTCGQCLEKRSTVAPVEVQQWKGCQKLYGAKNPGPKLWKAWEKADKSTPIPPP